jgi:hypothetical protein
MRSRVSSLHLAATLGLNCQGFLDSCLRAQFPLLKDVLRMKRDVLLGRAKQFGNLKLRQPDRLPISSDLKAGLAVFGGVEDQLAQTLLVQSRSAMLLGECVLEAGVIFLL